MNGATVEIDVGPHHIGGLCLAGAAEGDELNEVGGGFASGDADGADGGYQLEELFAGGEDNGAFFGFFAAGGFEHFAGKLVYCRVAGWVCVEVSGAYCYVQDLSYAVQGAFDGGYAGAGAFAGGSLCAVGDVGCGVGFEIDEPVFYHGGSDAADVQIFYGRPGP